MEYCFKSDVKPADLWKIAMKRIYKNFTGIINAVFTVAMILLTIKIFGTANGFIKAVLIFAVILFPILQPLAIYSRSIKQLEDLPGEMVIRFDDKGVCVECKGTSATLPWKRIKNAYKRDGMVVVMSDDRHGYMLTDRVLGTEKDEFFEYLRSKING